uniref:Essential MCU regulator, mitochondrial n=1 Tax=Culex tarsalis TaxID=7177 RepID=A0A1Q3FJU5_CULTA
MVLWNLLRSAGRLGTAPACSRTASGPVCQLRRKYTYRSGALKPMPHQIRFGLLGIVATVIPGLLIGAQISKNIANFLEENDLFVPSDDDDDDD